MNNKIIKAIIILSFISALIAYLYTGIYSQTIDKKIAGMLDNFTYMWLSGNSKAYTEEYKNLIEAVTQSNSKEKMNEWISLGKAYISAMNCNIADYSNTQTSSDDIAKYSDRINFIFSMINPDLKFNVDIMIKKKNLNDYDYLWIGNYYLLKRNFKNAQNYYIQGIRISSRLLSSFDIMLGVAEEAKLKKSKMSFICALPYIRAEDVFFFLSNELSLTDYKLVVQTSNEFNAEGVKKSLEKNLFPVYISGDSAYLSLGDLLLVLHTCLIKNGKENILTDIKAQEYLKEQYSKIAAYLLKKAILKPYIDGRLHLNSPVSGFFFADLYNNFIDKVR